MLGEETLIGSNELLEGGKTGGIRAVDGELEERVGVGEFMDVSTA